MNNTVFYQHLSKDTKKELLFNQGLKKGLVQEFDPSFLTRLRNCYYGFLSGLLYVYGEDTTNKTLGNKLQLIASILFDEDYELVHGYTDSTREINFSEYLQDNLDSNSWIEVKKGNKTWVYDPFSLLKFDKDLYYELEHPEVFQRIPKSTIISHPAYDKNEFSVLSGEFMLVGYLPWFSEKIKKSPYYELLEPELTRLKKIAKYDDVVFEWKQEKESNANKKI